MYLLSVIIPTKNRQKYCLAAVRQIMSLKEDIEICVQDNSDIDSLRSELEGLENVKYNYHQGVLSFVDNFSEAISLATGNYLCMIGDDDGILPNIIKTTEYLRDNSIEALIPGLNAVYFWPSDRPISEMYRTGCLVDNKHSTRIHYTKPKEGLQRLLKNGALNYTNYDLPRLYHGVVKREVLEMIKARTGTYFQGLTPDIYMAVALSFVCKNVIRVDFPITISGICPTSGSTDSATGRHTGNLKDAPHFRGHTNYKWDDRIPAFYSVETIWAETLVKAVDDFDFEMLQELNVVKLYEKCIELYPQFENEVLAVANKYHVCVSTKKTSENWNTIHNFLKKIVRRLVLGKPTIKLNIQNIEDAVRETRIDFISGL